MSPEFRIDAGERGISATFRHLQGLFPNLRCILLDGHPDLDPGLLSKPPKPPAFPRSPLFQPPMMLSIPHCQTRLPVTFFASEYLHNVVYLDVSDTPGSLKNALVQRTLGPITLPNLRIFKAQGREMDDTTARLLFRSFKEQLWSLDLSRNCLTDASLDDIVDFCSPPRTLRSESHFDVEGKFVLDPEFGSRMYGQYGFIRESEWSGDFTHPHRYMTDAPLYTREAYRLWQEDWTVRHDGRARIRRDSPGDIKQVLSGTAESPRTDVDEARRHDVCSNHGGVTHLRLNGNSFSAAGVEKLIRTSPGQLRHFECDSTSLPMLKSTLPPELAKNARFSGFIGAAHLFRPVLSPDLQVLRIHHSFVTQIPTLETDNLVTMANLWLAETFIRERVELAYPQMFMPDMNPRLYSLTLTGIPRYSVGFVTDRLIEFLKAASAQERAIQDAKQSSSRRSPNMLMGLRHIRLEFEADPTEELGHSLDSDDLDPEQSINLSSKEFSFFGDSDWASTTPERKSPARQSDSRAEPPPPPPPHNTQQAQDSARNVTATNLWPDDPPQEILPYPGICWKGNIILIPAWISNGRPGPHEAVNEYARLLMGPGAFEHAKISPATPSHVMAGVPAGSYIFSSVWDAMLRPPRVRKPVKADLAAMRDVLAAIREYRGKTKAAFEAVKAAPATEPPLLGEPHYHWTGALEVSVADTTRNHSSKFWR